MSTFQIVTIILLVIYLEGVLSIDNATVLAAMASRLPVDDPIPLPGPLRFLADPLRRWLGGQREASLKVGILGAYLGRGLMLLFASFIIQNPWLKVLGALYLVKLAFESLGSADSDDPAESKSARHSRFWLVVLNIELADLAFSLDNVVAVVAISNNFWLVMFGVAVGILIMRFAANLFTRVIAWEPMLVPAAYVLVLNIGIQLLLEQFLHVEIDAATTFLISVATLALAIAYARVPVFQILKPVFQALAAGMTAANKIINYPVQLALFPFRMLLDIFQ